MTEPAWSRVREIFDRVAEQPPAHRAGLLDELAGDDAVLRAEVEALLGALDAGGERLEAGGAALTHLALAEVTGELEGTQIGPYRLERHIGEGGMGHVYLAERVDGQFTRRVAIKVIRPGMDSQSVIRRFRQERQILAALNHPMIAALLDGGVTQSGRPYLVMEYVEGEPITEYCEKRALPVDERVRLFRDVCGAVHFAHQNLVIHRDLKPANILVTADGSPKLLDFGVAKLVRAAEDEFVTLTMMGERLLTPSYASPEQVRGELVSTASDVYSLGVILYELLTGRRPFDVPGGSLAAMLDAVSTREPTRPSVAVRDEPTQPASPDVRRALRRKLEGDLDNIVLMAIRKEPARRYASAHDLSEDLRRHLEGRPVRARPVTFPYRLGKFLSRNRVPVSAAAGILIAIGMGVTGTVLQAQRASVEKAKAVQRMQDIRELANSLLFEVHDAVADLPGATEARKLILERGFRNLEEIAQQTGGDPDLEWELAEAYLRIGLVQGQPTGASLGDLDAARASYGRAIDIARALVSASPRNARALRTLALSHEKLGDVKAWTGEIEEGLADARRALALYEELAAAMPDSARHQFSLAISLVKLGDLTGHPVFPNLGYPDSALIHYRRALDIVRSPPLALEPTQNVRRYDALIQERIGMMHRIGRRFEAAREAFRRSLEERERLAGEQPANSDARRDVGVTRQNLCEVELGMGNPGAAVPLCRSAVAVYDALQAADPSNAQAVSDVAVGALSLAGALQSIGDVTGALRAYERSIDMLRDALAMAPQNLPNRLNLARALGRHAALARGAGRASPFGPEAIRLLSDLSAEGHGDDHDAELLRSLTRG